MEKKESPKTGLPENNKHFETLNDKGNKKPSCKNSEEIEILKKQAFEKQRTKYSNVPVQYLIKPKFSDNDSNSLTKSVIAYIRLNGGQAERVNSTGRQIDRREQVSDVCGRIRNIGGLEWIPSSGKVGSADIHAQIRRLSDKYAIPVMIEIKSKATGDKYQSEGQKLYQQQIEQAGGIYLIIRDFAEFYHWFNSFIKST